MNHLIRWIIILLFPFMLGFGMIRAVIAWDYPAWEYARPWIPSDVYGWSDAERLEMANTTLEYLQVWTPAAEAIEMLEALRLPEDPATSLYNEREIKHMVDVKVAADQIRVLFWVFFVVCVLGLFYLWAVDGPLAAKTLRQSGWSTIILLTGIALFILVGWQFFFVFFHQLLFPPGTWTFYYTDSLIRLFPERFWFDVGVIISMGTLLLGVVIAFIGSLWSRAQ